MEEDLELNSMNFHKILLPKNLPWGVKQSIHYNESQIIMNVKKKKKKPSAH